MALANPWLALPAGAPYVLPEDEPYVHAFNARQSNPLHRINLSYPPEPRLGPISAPVVLLQLNPSYGAEQPTDQQRMAHDLASLRDESYPHLGVLVGDTWWTPRLRRLVKDTGAEKLARSICSIEFFPYRSRQFSHGHIRLPSQSYTFSLVKDALDRKAIIIVTRNLPLWIAALPALASAQDSVYCLRNPQGTFVTQGNLPEGAYAKVLNAIDTA